MNFVKHKTKKARAEELARQAEIYFDEHRSFDGRGDFRTTTGLDYVLPAKARQVPFCDHGGEGIGLVEVSRDRWYSKKFHGSFGWHPSTTTDVYLIGRNEAGTYFSHRVSDRCGTVAEALDWIWSGQADQIVARQGDVALIAGNGGPQVPRSGLPVGHQIVRHMRPEHGEHIEHDTHPPIPTPGKGQRLIVGKRALGRGYGAATQTRD